MQLVTPHDGDQIHIGDDITITVFVGVAGRPRLGIDAPADLPVTRCNVLAGPQTPEALPSWPVPTIHDQASLDAAKQQYGAD